MLFPACSSIAFFYHSSVGHLDFFKFLCLRPTYQIVFFLFEKQDSLLMENINICQNDIKQEAQHLVIYTKENKRLKTSLQSTNREANFTKRRYCSIHNKARFKRKTKKERHCKKRTWMGGLIGFLVTFVFRAWVDSFHQ